jgi:Na+-translocating ferredoxin:NAD+ oxidoreductase RnfE subunit
LKKRSSFLRKELLQNNKAEAKVLALCPYCGTEIGLLEVGFTWLDKKHDIDMHDKNWE